MIIVEGKIKGKARPRVYNNHAYTPKDTVTYENWVRCCYQNQEGKYTELPVKAEIYVYFSVPKSYSKKKKEECINNNILPVKKPDADNIAKIILDSLNGIAYKDDSQVVELKVIKRYTDSIERVEFELYEIK